MMRLLLIVLTLAVGGCAARPGSEALFVTGATVPGAKMVAVLVATDRGPDRDPHAGYGPDRAGLRYEELTISVPPGHRPGEIEWTESTARDPGRSFTVVRRRPLDEAGFKNRAAARVTADGSLGIFVHGYNYTLAEAAFRLAQIGADTNAVSVPVLFAWPSEGAVTGYVADRDAVTYARDDLAHVMEILAGIRTKDRIGLVAHSMGGWLVMEALRQLRLEGRDKVIDRYQVGLAAPDIDPDVFRRQVDVLGPLDPPLTILVATDDRALGISARLAGDRPRFGAIDVDRPDLQAIARQAGVRIVDTTSLKASDGARHNRFVRFASLQARAQTTGRRHPSQSLRQAGAFVFQAAGSAVASPFTLKQPFT